MKQIYVNTLEESEGKEVEAIFIVSRSEHRQTSTGSPYISLIFSDRTGQINAFLFEHVDELSEVLKRGNVVRVRAFVEKRKNQLQLKVQEAKLAEKYDIKDLIPVTPHDIEKLFASLNKYLSTVEDPYLRALLEEVFTDTDFIKRFKEAPAAMKYHHNYIGGLLEHTVSILKLADVISTVYPDVDRDLLLVGALLHDIGKVWEYRFTPFIEMTDEGRLIGHIVLGYEYVQDKIHAVSKKMGGFPEELKLRLLHLILSHHGELAKGSPVEPRTVEAQILHHLDYLDSRVWMFDKASQYPEKTGSGWSEYWRPLERSIFIGKVKGPPENSEEGNEEDRGSLFDV